MSNPNADPTKARLAKKRKHKPGNLQAVASKLWAALEAAEELLGEEDPYLRLKAVHAVSQVAGSYAKVYEVGELEARLQALEAVQEPGGLKVRGAA